MFYGSSGISTITRPDLDFTMMGTTAAAESQGLIAMKICPVLSVPLKKSTFPVVRKSQINQKLINDERKPGGDFPRLDVNFETASYETKQYGTEVALDRDETTYYEDFFQQDLIAAEVQLIHALKKYEERAIEKAVAAPASQTTLAALWTDPDSTPVTDMVSIKLELRAKQKLFQKSDLKLVLDYEVLEKLRLNTEIKDALATTRDKLPGNLTEQLIAEALGVGEIVIANSYAQTSSSGTADAAATYALQWNKTKAFLCIAKAVRNDAHRWANTLQWSKGANGWTQYYEERVKSDVLRYEREYGLHVVDNASALLISDVAA